MNSDEIVESLQPYGIVRTMQFEDKTFSAVVKLLMNGMCAEVKSDFRHKTMNSALMQVQNKVFKLIEVNPTKRIGHEEIQGEEKVNLEPEDKLLRLFKLVHGESSKCALEVVYDDDDYSEPIGINVMKHGYVSWYASRESLMFSYITKDWS